MLAREGLDEKQAPGDATQAPDANARLKARSRSLLLWSADRPRCTSASLRWGVVSEAALAARRRTGKACGSGDEGGEAPESGPPSLESENLSPKRRPPPIVDAVFTIALKSSFAWGGASSAQACRPWRPRAALPLTGPPPRAPRVRRRGARWGEKDRALLERHTLTWFRSSTGACTCSTCACACTCACKSRCACPCACGMCMCMCVGKLAEPARRDEALELAVR